ncbi:hypothetical protein HMPREF0185_02152 [Brevundimonas diminuta 470-4]|nr:hypothetical protein HMPREF0185_02152 [Brevundimonas diminuta 470-4]
MVARTLDVLLRMEAAMAVWGVLMLLVGIGAGVLALLRKAAAAQEDIRRIRSELTNLHFEVARRDRPPFGRRAGNS